MKLMLKALAPQMMSKAIEAFDRATMVIIGACWAAAVLMMGFALYAVSLSVNAKHAAEAALAAEPALPRIAHQGMDARELQTVTGRLQRRFPDLGISSRDRLVVAATEGSKFHEWLTALSYLDTLSPQYRWTIEELCVGKCAGRDLMHAEVVGEKTTFEMPQSVTKH
jgi:hypothetical protein